MARSFPGTGHLLDMARTGHNDCRVMEQDIRFCELDGKRVAYATVGEGPPLVFGAKWVSDLEEEWDDPRARAFYRGSRADAPCRALRQTRCWALRPGASGAAERGPRYASARFGDRRVWGRACDRLRMLVLGGRDSELGCSRRLSAWARSSSSGASSRETTSRKRRDDRSSTSYASTGRWRPRCSRASSCRTRAATRSLPSAATSVTRARRTSPPLSSSSSLQRCAAVPLERDDAVARAASPWRPHRAYRSWPRARIASPERTIRGTERRLALAACRRPARGSARARRIP